MISRRHAARLIGGAGVTLSLAPIGVTARSASSEGPGRSILQFAEQVAKKTQGGLTVLLPRGSEANVQPVADAFSAATGVQIKFVYTAVDEINTRILADTLTGAKSFDIALPATFGLPDLVEADALAPLDEFERKYADAFGANENLYATGDSFLGATYGFQTDGDVYVMFYLKSWLEDADQRKRFADTTGRELTLPDTWAELDRMMDHFHEPAKNRYGGALFRNPNYLVWEWWIRLHASGSWPVDDSFNPMINSPPARAALEALVESSKNLYPEASANGLVANWKAFAKGNIFCNIGWGGSQKFFNGPNSGVRGNLVYGVTPGLVQNGNAVRMPYFNWGWNYTVAKNSGSRELAYLFTRFAVSADMSSKAIRNWNGFFDPFRVEHYQDVEIRKTYSDAFLSVHRESMENSIPDFYVRNKGEYFDALRENIDRAVRGKASPKDALDIAATQWNQITRRLGKTAQARQWRSLKSKYPEAIRNALG